MPAPIDALRARLAELNDLRLVGQLVGWDQRTMMPPAGGPERAEQLATLQRIGHERFIADEVGEWLAAAAGADLNEVDRDIVRVTQRDYDRARRVPTELAAEMAQASAAGQDAWELARAEDDFAKFAPVLERNVELSRRYAACFDGFASPYDALLQDYDLGLTTARIQEVFGELRAALPPLVAERASLPAPKRLEVPVAAQQAAVTGVLARFGVDPASWRVDVSSHPFSTNVGLRDSRITTRYEDGQLESLLAAMHEFGHALYDRQTAPELARTTLADGTSMSIHESQSKLWENHVGRSPAFSGVLAQELTNAGFPVSAGDVHTALTAVRPTLIRVSADEVTYPLHIVMRFELERALVDGDLSVADLPTAWNDATRDLLGLEVPSDADGVLQDVHWSGLAFGYFPSYALGCLIAAQLWETLEADLGARDEALAAGDVAEIREWLRDKVHRHGRRLDTVPIVEAATGRGLDAAPFLRHVARSAAAPAG
ncbi:Thermostable carboxypeptidase 1 [Baekduia alba]|uniref:carboxypeptidase M32 n=1 Tax=Baekduia alba TaxID=2997333 RepID=UPI0023407361|nr:carboxypeptidase M32 [Baekduia alba]WCB94642.1 Thermostable carboxypeptidase 1 [Baekduia alba]